MTYYDRLAAVPLSGFVVLSLSMVLWIDPYILLPLWVLHAGLIYGTLAILAGLAFWLLARLA